MSSTRSSSTAPSRLTPRRLGVVLAALGLAGCLERPLCTTDCRPRTTNVFVQTVDQTAVDKIDLLFMIDNSASMADKQTVLAQAVPDLVQRLVTPNCVTDEGEIRERLPGGACPAGSSLEFDPVGDIHIGVITSSLGGHGGDNDCLGKEGGTVDEEEVDDHGHLLGTRPRFLSVPGRAAPVTAEGFLDWNPGREPGERAADVTTTFQLMTTAAGESGCGYEAQLESVYRFLVDPSPPKAVVQARCENGAPCAVLSGTDDEILRERGLFLRPDSLVAVILLTDENDCSIRDGGQGFFVATQAEGKMPRGSSVCVTNPNDPCCYSCASPVPSGCAADPGCSAPAAPDSKNLRCFDQKRRFGYDFLYPTARYVNALSAPTLCTSRLDLDAKDPARCPDADGDQRPDVVPSPLFRGARSPGLVFLAGIVGVPYQDLQAKKDPSGAAYTSEELKRELHYMTAKDLKDQKIWDTILGEPNPGQGAPPRLPQDGLMIESTTPSRGNDASGRPIPGPSAGPLENPINGHDWANVAQDDLQYACIFPLPADPRTGDGVKHCGADYLCDCGSAARQPGDDNPLCQDPKTGAYGTDQFFAKAYPGLRELAVLRDFGDNAIVASICARNLDQGQKETAEDYGYRPAVSAIVDRLKEVLVGRCLPRRLEKDGTGAYPCSVIEAQKVPGRCDRGRGRRDPNPKVVEPARERLRAAGFCDAAGQPRCDALSLCELAEAGPECHKQQDDQPRPGWCYVDPASNPEDDPRLVQKCDATERRVLRFVDPLKQTPAPGARVVIACFGAELGDDQP